MYAIRATLLIFMIFLGVTMLAWPGLYDTKRMSVAVKHYNAIQTKESLDTIQIAESKNRKEILVWETCFGLVFLLSAVVFTTIGGRIHANTSA